MYSEVMNLGGGKRCCWSYRNNHCINHYSKWLLTVKLIHTRFLQSIPMLPFHWINHKKHGGSSLLLHFIWQKTCVDKTLHEQKNTWTYFQPCLPHSSPLATENKSASSYHLVSLLPTCLGQLHCSYSGSCSVDRIISWDKESFPVIPRCW